MNYQTRINLAGIRNVTNERGETVASFANNEEGAEAFALFCTGVSAKGYSLFDVPSDQYLIGTLDQLTRNPTLKG